MKLNFLKVVTLQDDGEEYRVCVAKDEKNMLWHNSTLTTKNFNKNIFRFLGENPEKVCKIKTVNWNPVKCYGEQVKYGEISLPEISDIVSWFVQEQIGYHKEMKKLWSTMDTKKKLSFIAMSKQIFETCSREKLPLEIFRVRLRNLAKKFAK
jgi:hypothetical protein